MSESITRISDLPENGITNTQNTSYNPVIQEPAGQPAYSVQTQTAPVANYTVPPTPAPIVTVQPTMQQNYTQSQVQPSYAVPQSQPNIQIQYPSAATAAMGLQDQQYRLPSRDIPMNPTGLTQDVEIRANYVPPAPAATISDYVKEYEEKKDAKNRKYQQKKHLAEVADDIFSELQIPICIAILFFVFQMPIINTFLHKYFSFLMIYHEDGNFNTYGLLLKSIIFGATYYSISKFVDYLTTIDM
jgi:hypothetical protein